MKVFNFGLAVVAVALIAIPATAQLWVYEGFDVGNATEGQDLLGTANGDTSVGVEGGWVLANGGNGASAYREAGLSYPGSYTGVNTAIGGHGQNTGAPGVNSRLAIDFTDAAETAVNNSEWVWISFLAERVGPTVTEAGDIGIADRIAFNLASEYPRNFGLKVGMQSATNNNDLGQIGKGSDWNSNGVTYGDPNPLIIDTWGANDFEDVDAIYTGEDFADGTDHLVLGIHTPSSNYSLWANPAENAVPNLVWQHTDGGDKIDFVMNAIGLDTGNNSSDRPVGDWVIDEIRIAGASADAAGLALTGYVPEPSALAALCSLVGLAGLRRRC